MKPIRSLLVPIDFSNGSRAALTRALDLARRLEGNVLLLHVYHLPPYELTDDAVEATREDAKRSLDAWAKEASDSGVPVRARLEIGYPPDVIAGVAAAEQADLIVMATHGRTGLSHMLVGSVAERVVRHAACPVMTVRSPSR